MGRMVPAEEYMTKMRIYGPKRDRVSVYIVGEDIRIGSEKHNYSLSLSKDVAEKVADRILELLYTKAK